MECITTLRKSCGKFGHQSCHYRFNLACRRIRAWRTKFSVKFCYRLGKTFIKTFKLRAKHIESIWVIQSAFSDDPKLEQLPTWKNRRLTVQKVANRLLVLNCSLTDYHIRILIKNSQELFSSDNENFLRNSITVNEM